MQRSKTVMTIANIEIPITKTETTSTKTNTDLWEIRVNGQKLKRLCHKLK